MTIEEMNRIKKKLGLTYQQICLDSGVPISTVQKVLGGITKNPRVETMRDLENCLHEKERCYDSSDKSEEASSVGNTAVRKKDRHIYTTEEREQFPEWRRTELIDGVIYDMAAPSTIHQDICHEIFNQLDHCIYVNHCPCRVYMAPTDVRLDNDEYTAVQPDVFVVCDRKQITEKDIKGAPAFVLEVFSPSTKRKDIYIKSAKYFEAGTKEYWMIDPKTRQVIVCLMDKDENSKEDGFSSESDDKLISIYGFTDKIPLHISDGKCVIDMNSINEVLKDLYGDYNG